MKTKLILLFTIIFSLTTVAQKWTTYNKKNGLIDNFVNTIVIDAQGNKWFGTSEGVSKFDGKNWTTYMAGFWINAIAIDGRGNKWFGFYNCNGIIYKFDDRNWTSYTPIHDIIEDPFKGLDAIASPNGLITVTIKRVTSIAIDDWGNKWFGTDLGLLKYDGKNWTRNISAFPISSFAIDGRGNKWVAIDEGIDGILKFDGKTCTQYTKNDGLAKNHVKVVAIDAQDNIWVGFGDHGGGVSKFDGTNWTTYTTTNGLVNNHVHAIAIDGKGNIWFGTGVALGGGVSKFDGTNWTTYTKKNGLSSNCVTSIAIDAQGNKWFGTAWGGISEFRWHE